MLLGKISTRRAANAVTASSYLSCGATGWILNTRSNALKAGIDGYGRACAFDDRV